MIAALIKKGSDVLYRITSYKELIKKHLYYLSQSWPEMRASMEFSCKNGNQIKL